MIITLSKEELDRDQSLFDWALRSARFQGDKIVVEPGSTAYTKGSWSFDGSNWIGLAAGVTLDLTGSTLKLSPNAVRSTGGVERASKDLNLLWIGRGSTIIQGTLDANYADHPGWNCGGIRAFGVCTITGSTIVGLSGTKNVKESFAFSAEGATGGTRISGVTVRDCKVDGSSYVSGIYIGGTADNGVESVVEDCDVRLGVYGWFAYSSSYKTRIVRCFGESRCFWYTDTDTGIALIEDCSGDVSYSAIGSVATGYVDRRVVVARSKFKSIGSEGARWVEWWNKGTGTGTGAIIVVECEFTGFKWRSAIDASTGSVVYLNTVGTTTDGDSLSSRSFKPVAETIVLPRT